MGTTAVSEVKVAAGTDAPSSFDELYKRYFEYTVRFVIKLGIRPDDAEDTAQDILLRLYERDMLAMYDPGVRVTHDAKVYVTRFQAFLNAFIVTYVRGKRDAHARLRRRELLIMDKTLDGDTATTWGELFGERFDADFTEDTDPTGTYIRSIRARLELEPPPRGRDLCDLPRVFDIVLQGIWLCGDVDYTLIEQAFGISSTAARSWVRLLKERLGVIMGVPVG
jgi:hypothetical protein